MANAYNDVFIYSFQKENYVMSAPESFYYMNFRVRKNLPPIIVFEYAGVCFPNFP